MSGILAGSLIIIGIIAMIVWVLTRDDSDL